MILLREEKRLPVPSVVPVMNGSARPTVPSFTRARPTTGLVHGTPYIIIFLCDALVPSRQFVARATKSSLTAVRRTCSLMKQS